METKESSTIVAPSVVASCPGGDFIVVGGGGGGLFCVWVSCHSCAAGSAVHVHIKIIVELSTTK